MERISRYTDLLLSAGTFLHDPSAQMARLSLILCDNAVELLVYERCLRYTRMPEWMLAGRVLTSSDKDIALGDKFPPKIKFLVKFGDLNSDESEFVLQAHSLRNQAYHMARTQESIAKSVAWNYHELACVLFERLFPGDITDTGHVPCSQASRAVLEKAGMGKSPMSFTFSNIPALVRELRASKPAQGSSLASHLSASACGRFADLLHNLAFLERDGGSASPDEALNRAYWSKIDIEKLFQGLDETPSSYAEKFRRLDAAQTACKAPVQFKQITKWSSRAEKIAREISPTKALSKYMGLVRESKEVVDVVTNAAVALDDAIQQEIDRIRGK